MRQRTCEVEDMWGGRLVGHGDLSGRRLRGGGRVRYHIVHIVIICSRK